MKKIILFCAAILFTFNYTFSQSVSFSTQGIGAEVNVYGRLKISSSTIIHIEQLTILAGTAPGQVFDFYNDYGIEDTVKLLDSISTSPFADFEIYGSFNNSYSNTAPNILEKLNVYGWQNSNYLILKYNLINREETAVNAKIGLDIISRIDGSYGFDTLRYYSSDNILEIYKEKHVGIKLLNHEVTSLYSFEWYSGYTNDTLYYQWLNHGTLDSVYASTDTGAVIIPSINSVFLNPGDSISLYLAVAVSDSTNNLFSALQSAEEKYLIITDVKDNQPAIADDYELFQNYPNPFNPATHIGFRISESGFVSLKVYDILGNEVAILVNELKLPGKYEIKFDGTDLSSGVYFYQIKYNDFIQSYKMILLK